MDAAKHREAELLPWHEGPCFTLTSALEGARNWKVWISFSTQAEAVLQRDYFCTTETGMTRSLRVQMLRLTTRMIKKKFAKKRKGVPPPSRQHRGAGQRSFLWSRPE